MPSFPLSSHMQVHFKLYMLYQEINRVKAESKGSNHEFIDELEINSQLSHADHRITAHEHDIYIYTHTHSLSCTVAFLETSWVKSHTSQEIKHSSL